MGVKEQRRRPFVYSTGLFRGESRLITRGATGPMVGLGRGASNGVECGDSNELDGGMSPEIVSGYGKALA